MTQDDAIAMTQTLADLRRQIIDLRQERDYWRDRAEQAESECEDLQEQVNYRQYGRGV